MFLQRMSSIGTAAEKDHNRSSLVALPAMQHVSGVKNRENMRPDFSQPLNVLWKSAAALASKASNGLMMI